MDSRFQPLLEFLFERERIRIQKDAGDTPPWTKNPILASTKFCNIRREHDRTTRWLTDNWRTPHQNDPYLWFALVVARRCLNLPNSMEELGYPVPWIASNFLAMAMARRSRSEPVSSVVYKVVIGGVPGSGPENQVAHLLDPLWKNRELYCIQPNESLQHYHERLSRVKHMGNFYTAQVIADLKYTQGLAGASDWWSFAVPGPGSVRGMNRVMGRPYQEGVSFYEQKKSMGSTVSLSPVQKQEWLKELNQIRHELQIDRLLHAQDMQNCLCEFDKYERVRLNEGGRTRSYAPAKVASI